jgi:hypothetical protein
VPHLPGSEARNVAPPQGEKPRDDGKCSTAARECEAPGPSPSWALSMVRDGLGVVRRSPGAWLGGHPALRLATTAVRTCRERGAARSDGVWTSATRGGLPRAHRPAAAMDHPAGEVPVELGLHGLENSLLGRARRHSHSTPAILTKLRRFDPALTETRKAAVSGRTRLVPSPVHGRSVRAMPTSRWCWGRRRCRW